MRDELLGRANADRDYVVVGASPQTMLEQGFRQVGKDFPVFLHPQTKEVNYASVKTDPGFPIFEEAVCELQRFDISKLDAKTMLVRVWLD